MVWCVVMVWCVDIPHLQIAIRVRGRVASACIESARDEYEIGVEAAHIRDDVSIEGGDVFGRGRALRQRHVDEEVALVQSRRRVGVEVHAA